MSIPSPRPGEPSSYSYESLHSRVYDIAAPAIPDLREGLTEVAEQLATLLSRLDTVDPTRLSEAHKRLWVTRNMLNNVLPCLDRSEQALHQPPGQE